MFITLTIDTSLAKRSKVRFATTKLDPSKGWRRPLIIKKASLMQRVNKWFKSLSHKLYRLDGNIAMY